MNAPTQQRVEPSAGAWVRLVLSVALAGYLLFWFFEGAIGSTRMNVIGDWGDKNQILMVSHGVRWGHTTTPPSGIFLTVTGGISE